MICISIDPLSFFVFKWPVHCSFHRNCSISLKVSVSDCMEDNAKQCSRWFEIHVFTWLHCWQFLDPVGYSKWPGWLTSVYGGNEPINDWERWHWTGHLYVYTALLYLLHFTPETSVHSWEHCFETVVPLCLFSLAAWCKYKMTVIHLYMYFIRCQMETWQHVSGGCNCMKCTYLMQPNAFLAPCSALWNHNHVPSSVMQHCTLHTAPRGGVRNTGERTLNILKWSTHI